MFNQLHKSSRFVAATVLACGLMLVPVGCTPPDASLSGSSSTNTSTNVTTVTVTGTLTWKHQPLQKIGLFAPPPLSGSALASLDVTQSILTYTLSNASIVSTTGTVNIAVTDALTGIVVGQQDFAYDVRGNSLFAHDPNAVSNWLQQFTAYSNLDVNVVANTDMAANSPGTASVTTSGVYQGVTYVSSSASWTRGPIGGGGGCHTRICPNQ
jgi:hypothetical protein